MNREVLFQRRLQDISRAASDRGTPTYTDFLDMYELYMIKNMDFRGSGTTICPFGGYGNAERQMVAFFPDAFSFAADEDLFTLFPMKCLKLSPQQKRDADTLRHRDILGSLMSLGIERSQLGDILVEKPDAYVFVTEKMAPFLMENITSVHHTMLHVSEAEPLATFDTPSFREVTDTVASVRIDALVASAYDLSRGTARELVEKGTVFINGRLILSASEIPHEGDKISVRHRGRFQFAKELAQTKKGRIRIVLHLFGEEN